MERRHFAGLVALILVVVGLGALTYHDYRLGRIATTEASTAAAPEAAAAPAAPAVASATDPDKKAAPGPTKDESRLNDSDAAAAAPGTPAAPGAPNDQTALADPTAKAPGDAAATAPAISAPSASTDAAPGTAAAPSDTPTFDVVRVEPTGETAAAGLAAPGAKVELMDRDTVVGIGEANDRGEWTVIPNDPLKPGTHDLSLRATSPDGGKQVLSNQRVAVVVPDKGSKDVLAVVNEPGAPSRILDKPEAGATVAAADPTKPAASAPTADAPVAAAPADAATAPPPVEAKPTVTVDAVEADREGGLYVAGAASSPDPVRIYLNGELIGQATPGAEGKWLFESKRKLDPGKYSVRADQVAPASGDVLARAEVPFEREDDTEVATLKPVMTANAAGDTAMTGKMPAPESVIIRRGDNLWSISRRWYGKGMRYSTIYQANNDQIRDPHWIYPGQVFVMPAGNTSWTE